MTPFELYTLKKKYREETGNKFPFCDDIMMYKQDVMPEDLDDEFIADSLAYINWLQEELLKTIQS